MFWVGRISLGFQRYFGMFCDRSKVFTFSFVSCILMYSFLNCCIYFQDWNLFVDPLEFFEFLQSVETRYGIVFTENTNKLLSVALRDLNYCFGQSFANAYSLQTHTPCLQFFKIRCTPLYLHVRKTLSGIIVWIWLFQYVIVPEVTCKKYETHFSIQFESHVRKLRGGLQCAIIHGERYCSPVLRIFSFLSSKQNFLLHAWFAALWFYIMHCLLPANQLVCVNFLEL